MVVIQRLGGGVLVVTLNTSVGSEVSDNRGLLQCGHG